VNWLPSHEAVAKLVKNFNLSYSLLLVDCETCNVIAWFRFCRASLCVQKFRFCRASLCVQKFLIMPRGPTCTQATIKSPSKRVLIEASRFKETMVQYCATYGYAITARLFGVSRCYARYWFKKATDPSFHPNSVGGKRRGVFLEEELPILREFLWSLIETGGDLVSLKLCALLASKAFNRHVTTEVLSRLFKSWRWSWRIPSRVQILKYTTENIRRYAAFAVWIQEQDWKTVKFADEAHVVSKDLRTKKVLEMVNQRTWVKDHTLQYKSLSVTLLTQYDNPTDPVVISLREESNTQWDFCEFVINCVLSNHLVTGDKLVVDNACVHSGSEMFPVMYDILAMKGISLIFLPTYSPELNPCEYCFNIMKAALRNYHTSKPLWLEVVQAVAKITMDHVNKEYKNALLFENVERRGSYQTKRT